MAISYYDKFRIKSIGTSRGGWTKEPGAGEDAGKTIYTCTQEGASAVVNFEDGGSQDHPPAGAGPLKAGSKIKVTPGATAGATRVEVEEDV